jgi:hypothetical protein
VAPSGSAFTTPALDDDDVVLLDSLPLNYDETTIRTIEQIDVLWLKGRAIQRAFEVERVARLIGSPDCRKQWRAEGKSDRAFIRFVGEKFDEAMTRLGYRRRDPRDTVTVEVSGKGVYLYSLAFYSRHELGERFWKTTIAGTDPQIERDF